MQDLADALRAQPLEDQVRLLRLLPMSGAAAVFDYLPAPAQAQLAQAMDRDDLAAMLNVMAPDDRTLFLSELPAYTSRELLSLLDPRERADAERLLSYPEHSVGRLMTPDYVAIGRTWTMTRVLEHIRGYGHDSETLDVLYVVDRQGQLLDDLRIREVLLVPPDTHVRDLLDGRCTVLRATDDQQLAVEIFRREARTALPVLDDQGRLIGIVTIDDVLDAAQRIATREMHRFGGTEAIEDAYLAVPMTRMVRKRAGWLIVLLLGEMLTATAIGFFEDEIGRAVMLAMFIPLIISSGGNAGSQASTLIIRALAIGDLSPRDWWRVGGRETVSGLSLGVILGAVGFLRIATWSMFTDVYGPHWLLVALVVGLTLTGVVLWGALVGALLPFGLKRLGVDPATSSAPLVATLVDVTGLVIYFSIAVSLLRGTLL
jgi:magnesium transporter